MIVRMLVASFIFALLAMASTASLMPDFLTFGSCWEDDTFRPDFDISKMAGVWYTVKMVDHQYIPFKSCFRSNFSVSVSGGQAVRHDDGIDKNDEPFTKDITLDLMPEHTNLFILPKLTFRPDVHIWVLDAEYDSFACMYSCAQMLGMRAEFGGIISRTPYTPPTAEERCKAALDDIDEILYDKMLPLRHGEECPYWKEWQAQLKENKTLETDFKKFQMMNVSRNFTDYNSHSNSEDEARYLLYLLCFIGLSVILLLVLLTICCVVKRKKNAYRAVKATSAI